MGKEYAQGKRVHVFIDSSNIWQAQKAKGLAFDYEKLQKYLKSVFNPTELSVYYYAAYPEDGTRDYDVSGKHKFFTFLKKGLGFIVRKKPLKRIRIQTDIGDAVQEKGDMDVEITIDALHQRDRFDIAIFFTGDSDFLALVRYLRNGRKTVYVYSSQNNISQELRTGADGYTDVLKIQEDIWGRKLRYRKER